MEVRGDAPLLETSNGQVSYSVDRVKITAMPLDGRNFVPLIALSPGVALPGGGSLLPRINGSRPRTNEYLYDGISVLQPEPGQVAFYPILDAIEEFRLNLNSYSPEYGRSNGGTVMVTTRSGGNTLHGTLFEYLRNEHLNARNYFAPAGAEAGIPPQSVRRDAGRSDATEPDVLLRGLAGDASAYRHHAIQHRADRGATRRAFSRPRFSIPQPAGSRFRAMRFRQARLMRSRGGDRPYPLPNRAGAANNYVRTASEPDDQDQFDARLDRYFGGQHRVFGRYSYLRDDGTPVTPLPDGSGAISRV